MEKTMLSEPLAASPAQAIWSFTWSPKNLDIRSGIFIMFASLRS